MTSAGRILVDAWEHLAARRDELRTLSRHGTIEERRQAGDALATLPEVPAWSDPETWERPAMDVEAGMAGEEPDESEEAA